MTDRELLEEAMKSFEGIASITPKKYDNDVREFKAWAQSRARFMVDRIGKHLADHSPDAGNMVALELAKAVEAAIKPKYVEAPNGRGGVMIISKDYSEAATMIEQYAKRVPRAMLEEIERRACRNGDIGGCSCLSLNKIATKYGVKIEEAGE